jgi:hypothetical protein
LFFTATTTTTYIWLAENTATALNYVEFGGLSVKSDSGNHASQATSASRPILRARYNLLTYSEQFDNAGWAKSSCTITANQEVAPDGTTTVDLLQFSVQFGRLQQGSVTAGVVYTFSIWCRVVSGTRLYSIYDSIGNSLGSFTATTTLTRYSVTFTAPATATLYAVQDRNPSPFVDTYIWGADLRTGSSAGTYQRIAAATDYDTAGFLPYLYFVTDDSFGTNSIDFTATDKMSVCAGLTKLSDASIGTVIESSAAAGANNGTFAIYAPNSPNQYTARSAGTATGDVNITSGYAAPITNVLTMLGDISGDSNKLRINGTQVGQSTVDQGTGNYLSYPLYIGRRNNSSFPFEGRIYQMVVCGKTLSASELASTEAYVNQKTGAY